MYDFNDSPPCSPECSSENDGDSEFDQYFQNLLGIPWDEYLIMDEELKAGNPSHAPDGNTYNENVQELPDQEAMGAPIPTAEELIKSLENVQRFVLGHSKLFDIADQLMIGMQKIQVVQEVSNKSKQSTITAFFKS